MLVKTNQNVDGKTRRQIAYFESYFYQDKLFYSFP